MGSVRRIAIVLGLAWFGCGGGPEPEFHPEVQRPLDLEARDLAPLDAAIERLLAQDLEIDVGREAARREAEAIEALILRAPYFTTDRDRRDRAEPLRLAALLYASSSPEHREEARRRLRDARSFLTPGRSAGDQRIEPAKGAPDRPDAALPPSTGGRGPRR